MAKFTYAEATRILRGVEAQTGGDFDKFVERMVQHIRSKDPAFILVTRGVTGEDFEDEIGFYAWFYRWFVAE